MCTRFVCRRGSVVTGFNFDIDPAVWDHQVMEERDCFSIGILRPDGLRHSYHGVNRERERRDAAVRSREPGGRFSGGRRLCDRCQLDGTVHPGRADV